MYRVIRQHPTVRKLYADRLLADGLVSAEQVEDLVAQYRQALDSGRLELHQALGIDRQQIYDGLDALRRADWSERLPTGVEPARLAALGKRLVRLPNELVLQPRVAQVIANRAR